MPHKWSKVTQKASSPFCNLNPRYINTLHDLLSFFNLNDLICLFWHFLWHTHTINIIIIVQVVSGFLYRNWFIAVVLKRLFLFCYYGSLFGQYLGKYVLNIHTRFIFPVLFFAAGSNSNWFELSTKATYLNKLRLPEYLAKNCCNK